MSGTPKAVGIYTLGCKVNQYESEAIAERFAACGFSVTDPHEVCDIYVINSCTVTAESDRKVRQTIRRAIKQNPKAYILVTGCLAQTAPDSIAAIRGVDYICGNADKLSVVDAAKKLILNRKPQSPYTCVSDINRAAFEPMTIQKFDRTRAYIKIQDGCESHCTYCIIPAARGKIRSKSRADVLDEVRVLTEGGCREIVLTGIETASYGRDLDCSLIDLLEEVDRIEGVGRIRLGSLDPSLIKPAFVERLARLQNLAPHFHLSMQSGSNRILARMKRKYNAEMAIRGIALLRQALPHVQFTTDMILGFPGEGEEEFQETLSLIAKAKFLMIHAFPYSKRSGTPAAEMEDQVPESIRHDRVRILSAKQKEISASLLKDALKCRPEVTVLFEDYKDGYAFGHTDNFIEVRVAAPRAMHSMLAQVRVTDTYETGLTGTLV